MNLVTPSLISVDNSIIYLHQRLDSISFAYVTRMKVRTWRSCGNPWIYRATWDIETSGSLNPHTVRRLSEPTDRFISNGLVALSMQCGFGYNSTLTPPPPPPPFPARLMFSDTQSTKLSSSSIWGWYLFLSVHLKRVAVVTFSWEC